MSREAWGEPPEAEPVCCPDCGKQTHSEGCYVCELDAKRIALQSEVSRLRAALQELVDGYTPQYERMSADSPYKPMWAEARAALTPNC